ncbi:hypothetical protein [Lactococcus garvieae]|jgi:hypothetical protein|uniref:Uncharacterized protein n=1 Tax=Lactococcus garvieae DCC43 TaxID=1231377 RepID=K2PHR0_9LACT|nr:hypothetical protein [Lactococcus garvieae]EKF50970.1 hypothetical protein C426_1692 [Lactococcus garvieae DCC43]QPS71776.1 hypothetical protein I6G50_03670 [Lactococcus garvieae]
MNWIEYFEAAAKKSRGNAKLWLRYLNKAIQRDQIYLSQEDIDYLVYSEELTYFQRIFLSLAVEEGTRAWEMTVSLSEPSQFTHLKSVLQELKN